MVKKCVGQVGQEQFCHCLGPKCLHCETPIPCRKWLNDFAPNTLTAHVDVCAVFICLCQLNGAFAPPWRLSDGGGQTNLELDCGRTWVELWVRRGVPQGGDTLLGGTNGDPVVESRGWSFSFGEFVVLTTRDWVPRGCGVLSPIFSGLDFRSPRTILGSPGTPSNVHLPLARVRRGEFSSVPRGKTRLLSMEVTVAWQHVRFALTALLLALLVLLLMFFQIFSASSMFALIARLSAASPFESSPT